MLDFFYVQYKQLWHLFKIENGKKFHRFAETQMLELERFF
jgi:hypothetical protein